MTNLQAVVFDLDDTLYLERDYVYSGFSAVADWTSVRLGLDRTAVFEELWNSYKQGVRGDTFNLLLNNHSIKAKKWIPDMVQVYREHDPVLKPFADVRPLIARLKENFRLGLITEGCRISQEKKLQALDLDECFEAVVIMGLDEREFWKPHTRPFEQLFDTIGLPPEAGVYIGDNPTKDFYGARRLGMRTVRVIRTGGQHAGLAARNEEYAADVVYKDFSGLIPLFNTFQEVR